MINLNKLTKDLNFEKIDEILGKGSSSGSSSSSCSSSSSSMGANCNPMPDERPGIPTGPPE